MSKQQASRLSLSAQEEESSQRQQQPSQTDHGRGSQDEVDSGEESSSRAPNFTDEETNTLINQVIHYSSQLFGSKARNVHHRFKGATWDEISHAVSLDGSLHRSTKSCKKRLRDCRRSVARKIQNRQKLYKDWEKKMENYFQIVQEEMPGTSDKETLRQPISAEQSASLIQIPVQAQPLQEETLSLGQPPVEDQNLVQHQEQIPVIETFSSVAAVLGSWTQESMREACITDSQLSLILEALRNMEQHRAEESQRIHSNLDNMEQNINEIKAAIGQQTEAMLSMGRYYEELVSSHLSLVGQCQSMQQKIEQISTTQNEQKEGQLTLDQLCRQLNEPQAHIKLQCKQINQSLQSMLLWQQQCNINTRMISTNLQLMTEGRRLHRAQPQQAEQSSQERDKMAHQRRLEYSRMQQLRWDELEQAIAQQEMWATAQEKRDKDPKKQATEPKEQDKA